MGLPKRKPGVFKPAFSLPPKLLHSLADKDPEWDEKGSVIQNYKSFGVVSNPNLLSVRSRTPHIVESDSLQVPLPSAATDEASGESELLDSGSELEEDGQSDTSFFKYICFYQFTETIGTLSSDVCAFFAPDISAVFFIS